MSRFEMDFTEAFARRIESYRFNKKRQTSVYRKTKLGRCGARLGFVKKLYGFDIRAHLFIRYDAVERIIGQFLQNKYWRETSTLDIELGTFIGGDARIWSVRVDEDKALGNIFLAVLDDVGIPKSNVASDVENTLAEIVSNFEIFGLPFLEKYCESLENALELLSMDEERILPFCHSLELCSLTAITVAFLLDDRAAFHEIADQKERLLEMKSRGGLINFRGLRNQLQEQLLAESTGTRNWLKS